MSDQTTAEYFHPARIAVIHRATPAELLDILAERFSFGDDMETPFFFGAEISSNRLDAYYTHMGESTLQNFAADAAAGVSLLDSHDSNKLGMGYSLTGEFSGNAEIIRTRADFYTVRGVQFGGKHSYASTDDFIRAVLGGIVRDVSVGFYGGDMICDICGELVWGWFTDCPHLPGVEYAIGDQGEKTTVATAEIVDAHLAEVSAVYSGATPGAMIDKIERMFADGELQPWQARQIEHRYKLQLTARRSWAGIDTQPPKQTGGKSMSDKSQNDGRQNGTGTPADQPKTKANPPSKLQLDFPADIRDILKLHSVIGDDGEEDLYALIRFLDKRCAQLTNLADDGRTYHADLIESAITEGVRAMGDKFDQEAYRELLAGASLDRIRAVRDSFAATAASRFKGGRSTVDGEQPTTTEEGDQAGDGEREGEEFQFIEPVAPPHVGYN